MKLEIIFREKQSRITAKYISPTLKSKVVIISWGKSSRWRRWASTWWREVCACAGGAAGEWHVTHLAGGGGRAAGGASVGSCHPSREDVSYFSLSVAASLDWTLVFLRQFFFSEFLRQNLRSMILFKGYSDFSSYICRELQRHTSHYWGVWYVSHGRWALQKFPLSGFPSFTKIYQLSHHKKEISNKN